MAYQPKWDDVETAKVLDVAQVVELEQAIAANGTSLDELMQRAGACVADFVEQRIVGDARIVVFCGSGNNGGDGWVAARLFAADGLDVRLITPCAADDVPAHPAAEAAARCMREAGHLENLHVHVAPSRGEIDAWLADADVIVDALLGTGFHYPSLREPTRTYVDAIATAARKRAAAQRPRIVSVDVPSGMNAQTGSVTDPVVTADETVCMMTLKTGMVESTAAPYCGKLHVAHIADF